MKTLGDDKIIEKEITRLIVECKAKQPDTLFSVWARTTNVNPNSTQGSLAKLKSIEIDRTVKINDSNASAASNSSPSSMLSNSSLSSMLSNSSPSSMSSNSSSSSMLSNSSPSSMSSNRTTVNFFLKKPSI
ncbi:unnamed protein product [Rotaria magnacalcarata]|uniref:Uncharacterized protein n=1 Tax=Rotaria magnacalcarata TaxID=392030 RepID=A0A815PDJ7_9BILA|nr:unnamed protein product [Rotaria magnacalcarata]CAF2235709.1 unnamed protein product [Rotaria magnacalcarata]CAF4138655.1 unnamed protein product [Rotaria magnacalcarata]CAF4419172.1 unnamed protein product [Rotaria magnacalcarata]